MLSLAKGFHEHGLEVHIVVGHLGGPLLTEVHPEVRLFSLDSRRISTGLIRLAKYLREERPTVMISGPEHVTITALAARSLTRSATRVIATIHSSVAQRTANTSGIRVKMLPVLARLLFHGCEAIVAVSTGAAEDFAKSTGLPAEQIKVIYNPVMVDEIRRAAGERPDHEWFESVGPPVVLAAGRLTRAKDYPTLIRAFATLRQSRSARLIILGEGDDRPSLERMVRSLGIEADTAMPGFTSNPYAFMANSTVFVSSSRWEGLSVVLAEAMVCGVPIVATDCQNGPGEILAGGRYGRLVPVEDHKALAEAMREALDMTEPVSYPAEAIDRFLLDTIVKQYLKVIDADAGPMPKPA